MNKKDVSGLLVILVLFLVACNSGDNGGLAPVQLPTAIVTATTELVATEPPVTATATLTATEVIPTEEALSPTSTVTAPTVVAEGPTRISFAPGDISAVIQGRISEPGHDEYVLRAMAGQLMTVNIESPNNDVRLTLYGLDDGQPLSRADTGATYWRDTLAATQDYSISAVYNGPGSEYTLTVRVDPIPAASSGLDTTLQFAPGSDFASVTGVISTAFTADTYRVQVTPGQTIFVSVASLTSPTQPTVTVFSSQSGHGSPDGIFHDQQQWAGQLGGGEHQIVVNANQANVDYVLDVRIINTSPDIIQFAPGTTSSTVNGYLGANEVIVYALEAFAGQEMHAQLGSHTGRAQLFVELTDLSAYLGFDSFNGQTAWQGILPRSGPYYLFVTSRYPQTFSLNVGIVTPSMPVADAGCPMPTAQQRLFVDPIVNYCFLYPAGLRAHAADQGIGNGISGTAVWGPPLDSGPEPLAVGMNITHLEAANGRSAQQIASDYISQTGGELGEEITVGGETAVVVNNIPGLFPLRSIFLVHNDQVYHFQFAPEGVMTTVLLPGLEDIYQAVIASFVFTD